MFGNANVPHGDNFAMNEVIIPGGGRVRVLVSMVVAAAKSTAAATRGRGRLRPCLLQASRDFEGNPEIANDCDVFAGGEAKNPGNCCANFGRPLIKKVMSHSRDVNPPPLKSPWLKLGGQKKTNKDKQLFGIVPGMGGGQICLRVAFFLGDKGPWTFIYVSAPGTWGQPMRGQTVFNQILIRFHGKRG